MCGRFSLTKIDGLNERFNAELPKELIEPNYNAAPSQKLIVIPQKTPHQMRLFKWGLMPYWLKGKTDGMINIRVESLKEKPIFKKDLREHRCLVLADGFYEWKKEKDGKHPFRIILKDKEPFAFAGICQTTINEKSEEVEYRFAIITTAPNKLMSRIYTRMPVILEKKEESQWLDDRLDPEKALKLLISPYSYQDMLAYEVSRIVNSPRFNNPAVILPKI